MTYRIREAQLAGGRVRFVMVGSGPALVLIHGLGGNWQNWLANIPELAQRHCVVAVDLPGFGRSDQLQGAVTMGRYADVVIELMDELEIEAGTLVGNSMGGLLSLEAAVRHPGRGDGAGLACSGR